MDSRTASWAAVTLLAACATSHTTDAGVGTSGGDAAPIDASCPVPAPPYGPSVGSTAPALPPLTNCRGGTYDLYGPELCDARYTLVVLAKGWCGPSQHLADVLSAQVTDVYGPRGLRVVEVLTADDRFAPPTTSFCASWISTHGLRGEVELLDPGGSTGVFNPGDVCPVALVFDARGTVMFHLSGPASAAVDTLVAELETLLPPT